MVFFYSTILPKERKNIRESFMKDLNIFIKDGETGKL